MTSSKDCTLDSLRRRVAMRCYLGGSGGGGGESFANSSSVRAVVVYNHPGQISGSLPLSHMLLFCCVYEWSALPRSVGITGTSRRPRTGETSPEVAGALQGD